MVRECGLPASLAASMSSSKDNKVYCCKCNQETTYADSKPLGAHNLDLRIETLCGNSKRRIERRTQKRPKTDPLVAWWKGLKGQIAVDWYILMKEKGKRGFLSDEELMVVTKESHAEGIEKRGRREFYGFETIVEENPTLTET